MADVSVSDARARLADLIDQVRVVHEPVFLTRRGRRIAAVIGAEDLESLIASVEDFKDLEAVRTAREEMEAGEPAIPWEDVKADLGLM